MTLPMSVAACRMESASSSRISLLRQALEAGMQDDWLSGVSAAWTPGVAGCTKESSSPGSCCAGCPLPPCKTASALDSRPEAGRFQRCLPPARLADLGHPVAARPLVGMVAARCRSPPR
eukprot:15107018-Heterocapsa_arctica.AAC.1